MNPAEYDRMYALENTYWWFVARRRLALRLSNDFGFRIADCGIRAKTPSRNEPQSEPIVLDLGCGTGAVLQELSKQGKAIGVDMSSAALAYCRRRGLSRLTVGRGERLPIRSNCANAVIALDVFEHIEDDVSAIKETYRVLRPGGVLILSVPAFMSLWGPHDVALMHFRRYRKKELKQKLVQAGFQIEKLSYSVFFLFPIVVIFRLFEKRKKRDAEASLPSVPGWLNRMLLGLQGFEASLISGISLPWGSSLVAVARKPKSEPIS